MRSTFKFSVVYTALFAGVSFGAFAETVQQENEQLDEIQVTSGELKQIGYHAIGTTAVSKVDVPLIDTPTTVSIVTSQLIQDRKVDNLQDALASVSGVSQANTLGGVFDAVQKRGFGSNRDNSIMRNGIESGPSQNFGATTETVEVLKGPASVLYGIQDPGGIINVVTKKPQQEQKTVIGGTVGNNNMWGTQFDSTGGLGNGFAYRFIYDKQDKDYWRNFGKIERTTYAPSLSYESENTKLLLAYEHLDYIEPFDRGTVLLTATGELPNIPVETRLDEPNNETIGKVDRIQVKLEQKLNDTWKLNANYGYTRSLYSYNQARLNSINLTTGNAVRFIEQQNNGDQRVHAGSLNLVGEFSIGEIANRFIVGVDASRNYRHIGPIYNANNSNGLRSPINIYNPVYTNPTAQPVNVNGNAYQYNYVKTAGVYVQDTAYLTDKLIVTGGIRYEYYDQFSGRHGLGGSKTGNTDQHGGDFLYQLGTVYKFTPNWAAYANYAESFRPQYAIAQLVESSLSPEQGKSFEIGAKYEGSRISAALALFNIDKENVAESATCTDGSGNSCLYIVGKQRSRGVELDVNGYITDKLSLALTYGYTNVKSTKNDTYPIYENKQLSGVPKHQGSLFLKYDVGSWSFGNVRLGGGARYLGSWYAYNSTYTAQYKIPHAVIYDAFVAYDTQISGKKLTLQFNAKNLSDKTYFPSTAGNASGTLIPVALGYGREYLLNAKIEF
ncbi:TonB-dependent siderophore receptor [Lonepinella sp. BR2271]|uniref:TonB-dependent siderophore receptor n=1 Tax=Lonepinella sp. BR2271 TaxID=3434550 RepID=UPI003F6E1122